MTGPLEQTRQHNHAQVWFVSLFLAGALVGLAYFLFASFEHDSWFPGDLARFLNRNEVAAFGGGGAILWFLIAMLFYRLGTFSRPTQPDMGWGSGPDIPGQPVPGPITADGSTSKPSPVPLPMKEGKWPALPVVLNRDRRACVGDLVLTDRRFYFVCYLDKSLAKSSGGKAVAHQFGLVGALVHALIAGPGEKRERQRIETLRAEFSSLSLEEQVGRSRYSLSLAPGEISLFSSTALGGTKFEAGGKKYPLPQFDKSNLPAIKDWCDKHGIQTKGF